MVDTGASGGDDDRDGDGSEILFMGVGNGQSSAKDAGLTLIGNCSVLERESNLSCCME